MGQQSRHVAVAMSILLCAVVLFPWARNRETICGFVGRHASAWWFPWVSWICDALHRESGYCIQQAQEEEDAREIFSRSRL